MYKPKAKDIIDFDSLKMLDSDHTEGTDTKTTKRRTRNSEPLDIRSNYSKKQKSSETSTIECASLSLPVSEVMDSTSQPLDGNTLPDSPTTSHPISTITKPHAASSSKEMATSSAPARFRARPLKFSNLLTPPELTTSVDQQPLIPPSPSEDIPTQSIAPAEEQISTQPTKHSLDHSDMVPNANPPAAIAADSVQTTTMVPLLVVDASTTSKPQTSVPAKKSRKMQIGKAQNGQSHRSNLCTRKWLAHNKTGSAAKFKTYYDGLLEGQKKSYNDLTAKKLVNDSISDTILLQTSCDLSASPHYLDHPDTRITEWPHMNGAWAETDGNLNERCLNCVTTTWDIGFGHWTLDSDIGH
ncbi:hypothetical protein EV424DRAFT_1352638 [Suillus variegatus]|nr:hypothetical protein EV424DRAFT_1352638 [Suillus variegatus]